MPELPEVEREARLLARALGDGPITRVDLADPRVVLGGVPSFRRALHGVRVVRVTRIGKHIVAELSSGALWWTHLRMTGGFVPVPTGDQPPRGARFVVRTTTGGAAFVDPRRFGKTTAGAPNLVRRRAHLDRVGPDALTHGTSVPKLRAALAGARGPIKVVLLDQSRLAGLGNLHVAEALFRARIHPATPTPTVRETRNHLVALSRGIRAALQFGLREVMRDDFAYLHEGASSPYLVYDRKGAPCVVCETPITRIVLAGRGTYLCARCQVQAKN